LVGQREVIVVLVAEITLVALGMALLVGHGAGVALRERVLAPRMAAARAALVRALQVGRSAADSAAVGPLVGRLPLPAQLRLLGDLTPSISGAQHTRLTEVAADAGLLGRAAQSCCSRRWKRRLRGARLFTLLGGGDTIVPELFDDPHPEVRAQAAAWAAGHSTPAVVARLLEMLTDEQTLCRFTVKDSLLRIGRPALEPLAAYLDAHDGARALAALDVAVWLPDVRLLDSALRLARDELAGTRSRAARVLGSLPGARSAEALDGLLLDSSPEVRAAAAQALGRLHHWPAAARLAEALCDRAWDVRLQAGLALRGLGSPGLLMLRRSVHAPDRFAADMSRLVLDLPEGATQ
jgi:HEAT repeats